ncbi:MAG: hypothetical protein JRI23_19930, partial [Deltaproteobacteria bacterium]|nr:hypothetical protein [Deltaproteobacteria bacterium]MBW2534143.1 hypothetical protein [Deltaproteobacteria bacterium]
MSEIAGTTPEKSVAETAAQAQLQADELAAQVILAVHRVAKQSTLYEDENEARIRQLESTLEAIKTYGMKTGRNISLFWMEQSVFVGRRLLRAGRSIYTAALELAEVLKPLRVSQIVLGYDVPMEEIRQLQEVFCALQRGMKPTIEQLSFTRIRLRRAPDLARRFVDERNLPAAERAMRTYAKAVVVMRRFVEGIQKGESQLPIRVRRISQQLVDVAQLSADDLLALAVLQGAQSDDAARAVNASVLALLMAQQLDVNPRMLSRIATATLLVDAGKPRVAGMDTAGDVRMGTVMPRLAEQQYSELPGATAAVLTQLAGVNDSTMMQNTAVIEALHVRHPDLLGPAYNGLRQPTSTARIIAMALRFVALNASRPNEDGEPMSIAEVVTRLQLEATDPADKNVFQLLVAVLHVYPTGALVEMSTGELAQVMDTPGDPARFSKPFIRVVVGADKQRLAQPRALHLALQPDDPGAVRITRVIALPDEGQLRAALESQRRVRE